MKTAIVVLAMLAMVAGACGAEPCSEKKVPTLSGGWVYIGECCTQDIPSDVIKALELAVKRTSMKNTYLIEWASVMTIPSMSPTKQTPAERKRQEAKEALERAELEAADMEQHDKDIQFIRDVLQRVKGGK